MNLQVLAAGSYRRGKQECGDVDILISRNDDLPHHGILEKLIVSLEEQGFLKERLGNLRLSHTGSEGYMGVC